MFQKRADFIKKGGYEGVSAGKGCKILHNFSYGEIFKTLENDNINFSKDVSGNALSPAYFLIFNYENLTKYS